MPAILRRAAPLLAGAALLALAMGRWVVPLAAWLAPVFWLRFVQTERGSRATLPALLVWLMVWLVAWSGYVPAPLPLYVLIVAGYGLAYFLPLLAYRELAPRLPPVAATLVFPLAWVVVEYLLQVRLSPYGSWFSLAYSQASFLGLLQLASVTGTTGISLLVTWCAAAIAWTWSWRESPRAAAPAAPADATRSAGRWRQLRAPALVAGVLLLVLGAGELRLALRPRSGGAVRVAALLPDPTRTRELQLEFRRFRRAQGSPDAGTTALVAAADRLNADLLARTARAARGGARIVAWSETAGRVLGRDEPALLRAASGIAARAHVAVLPAYGVFLPQEAKPLRNRVAAIAPDGRIAWTFDKAHPIVGPESPFVPAGDGRLRILRTPQADITVAICHDFDFPGLLRQASARGATLLVDPSADWHDITKLHAQMALMRAVENGIPLLRPTSDGRTLVTDAYGVTLAQADDAQGAVAATLTPMRTATVYGQVGDVFAWICLLALALLAWRARPIPASPAPGATVGGGRV